MKKKINNWLFNLAKKRIAISIVKNGNIMTNGYLLTRGFIPEWVGIYRGIGEGVTFFTILAI